jgi:hypothetical protein
MEIFNTVLFTQNHMNSLALYKIVRFTLLENHNIILYKVYQLLINQYATCNNTVTIYYQCFHQLDQVLRLNSTATLP